MNKIHVLVFCEDKFDDIYSFSTLDIARGFSIGIGTGASLYGAGGCNGYIVPGDEEKMKKDISSVYELAKALTALNKEIAAENKKKIE